MFCCCGCCCCYYLLVVAMVLVLVLVLLVLGDFVFVCLFLAGHVSDIAGAGIAQWLEHRTRD